MNDVDRGRIELKDILRLIQVELHEHVLRITVGSVEQLLDQTGESYASAKKAQEYFWVYPELYMIDAAN